MRMKLKFHPPRRMTRVTAILAVEFQRHAHPWAWSFIARVCGRGIAAAKEVSDYIS